MAKLLILFHKTVELEQTQNSNSIFNEIITERESVIWILTKSRAVTCQDSTRFSSS